MDLPQCERGVGQAAPLLPLLFLLLQGLLPVVFEFLDPCHWRLPLQQDAGGSRLKYRSLHYSSFSGASKPAYLMQGMCRANTLVGGRCLTHPLQQASLSPLLHCTPFAASSRCVLALDLPRAVLGARCVLALLQLLLLSCPLHGLRMLHACVSYVRAARTQDDQPEGSTLLHECCSESLLCAAADEP